MVAKLAKSPRILESVWGQIEVEGFGKFKDVKLWPGGAREWDWSETGMSHDPGIQLADLEELLSHEIEVIVLSQGHHLRLLVPEKIQNSLREQGIEVIVAETNEAVRQYNLLCTNQAVGGLFHSTC